jgi:hypothetical protein
MVGSIGDEKMRIVSFDWITDVTRFGNGTRFHRDSLKRPPPIFHSAIMCRTLQNHHTTIL